MYRYTLFIHPHAVVCHPRRIHTFDSYASSINFWHEDRSRSLTRWCARGPAGWRVSRKPKGDGLEKLWFLYPPNNRYLVQDCIFRSQPIHPDCLDISYQAPICVRKRSVGWLCREWFPHGSGALFATVVASISFCRSRVLDHE